MDKELTKVLRTLTRKNDKEKRSNTLVIVFAIIGAAAVIGVVVLHNTFTLFDGIGFFLVFLMLALISRPKKAAVKSAQSA